MQPATPLPWQLAPGKPSASYYDVVGPPIPHGPDEVAHESVCRVHRLRKGKQNLAYLMHAANCLPALVAALEEIAMGMGNLALDQMGPSGVHGINDGKQRAIYLERFVGAAREVLALVKKE